MSDINPAAFRCLTCSGSMQVRGDEILCREGHGYPVVDGIVDALGVPDEHVAHELTGLALENGVTVTDDFAAVKHLKVDHIETTEELMAGSRHEPTRYYQQTAAAFYEGLARAQPDAGMRVLEIGAERTYFNLRSISDLCAEAWALNIFFHEARGETLDWPVRVLGDMNRQPFADGYFDLVICSATLHHTATLSQAVREVARIIRPGGRAIIVNEPVEGRFKRVGQCAPDHDRDEHIHEDPVTRKQWMSALRVSGLRPEFFVPAWFLQEIARDSGPSGRRFARLASGLRPVLQSAGLRDVARVAGRPASQALLGIPMNVVLWKD